MRYKKVLRRTFYHPQFVTSGCEKKVAADTILETAVDRFITSTST
jgi:hypothetical protein